MPTSYLSISEFPGDGVTTEWEFNFAGGYISREHVRAYTSSPVGVITPVDITSAFISDFKIEVSPPVPTGYTLRIYRDTPREEPIVNFTGGSNFTEANLDLLARQTIFAVAEAFDAGAYASVNDLLGAAGAALEAANASASSASSSAVSANGSAVTATAQAVIAALRAAESANSALISAANNDAARSENAIVNGRMWQAPDGVTSWTSPASGTYMLGLWQYLKVGATGKLDAALVSTGPVDCPTALQYTCTTAQQAMSAGDAVLVEQVLEARNSHQFIGKTFTVRGIIKSDVSGDVPVCIRNSAYTHSYVFPVTAVAGVEAAFEHTVIGGLTGAASWGVSADAGARVGVCLAAGSVYQSPSAGSWVAGDKTGLAGQVNAVGAVNRKITITKVSLCLGTAKPMADDYATDVRRMRWWYRPYEYFRMSGYTTASAGNFGSQPFESMRIPPSVSIGSNTASNASVASLSIVYTNTVVFSSVGSGVGGYINDIFYGLDARY